MNIVHLTASTFLGGPERQMLGLGRALGDGFRSTYVSFPQGGECRAFITAARREGFGGVALRHDSPRFLGCIKEIGGVLADTHADVLLCHGYKANLLGRPAARRAGIPAVAVARGWTGENRRAVVYEKLDRLHLRLMDHVVAVSAAQAERVRRAGVAVGRIHTIHNAVNPDRFAAGPGGRDALQKLFRTPRRYIVGAAGRLSREKGFEVLVDAAKEVVRAVPAAGFVLFGEGVLAEALGRRIRAAGLEEHFLLPGFRRDLDRLIPAFDVLALPSYTEGLPNVVLEAFAAGVPVVATAVGGTPELVANGINGRLAPPGDARPLAAGLLDVLADDGRRRAMGAAGRRRVASDFTFAAQAAKYRRLLRRLVGAAPVPEVSGETLESVR